MISPPSGGITPKPDISRHKSQEDEDDGSFSSADKIIADYLEPAPKAPDSRSVRNRFHPTFPAEAHVLAVLQMTLDSSQRAMHFSEDRS
jgi:hypothetical protein